MYCTDTCFPVTTPKVYEPPPNFIIRQTVNAGTDYRDLDPLTYPCMEAVRVKERLNDKVTEYKYTTTKMIWTLFDALNPEPTYP